MNTIQYTEKLNNMNHLRERNLFTVVEVEVNSLCNRKCSYCPVSILPKPSVLRYMSKDVFNRLIIELKKIEFSGRFSYQFYNEPLLRRDLENLVQQVSIELPDTYQVLYTNGDLLSEERYKGLKETGIAHFIVTRHDFSPIPERELQTVLLPTDLQLTNRGGIMSNLSESLTLPCYAPSEMLIVTVTGDVILCYEDAKRTQVMGNILESSIEEIWFSQDFVELRKSLVKGNRDKAASICENCSNQAHHKPNTSWFAL